VRFTPKIKTFINKPTKHKIQLKNNQNITIYQILIENNYQTYFLMYLDGWQQHSQVEIFSTKQFVCRRNKLEI